MNPETYRALMAPLKGLWPRVQEHVEAVADTAQQAADAGHVEEWGTEAMIHHVIDAPVWEFEPFHLSIPLDQIPMPAFDIGGVHVDLSITKHVLFLMMATFLTVLTMYWAAKQATRLEQGKAAPKGILNTMEVFYLYLRDEVVMANIGKGGEKFAPLVITLFYFILYANVLGLLPWGATATSNIMVTSALAIVALVVIETAGFVALGPVGYAKTIFFLPPGLPTVLKPIVLIIMAPVELIGKFSKIVALAIRLFANMTAGHFVILALLGLIITYGSFQPVGLVATFGAIGLGLFVMLLEIFVAFVQAFIFSMLVAVFIGLTRHAH